MSQTSFFEFVRQCIVLQSGDDSNSFVVGHFIHRRRGWLWYLIVHTKKRGRSLRLSSQPAQYHFEWQVSYQVEPFLSDQVRYHWWKCSRVAFEVTNKKLLFGFINVDRGMSVGVVITLVILV